MGGRFEKVRKLDGGSTSLTNIKAILRRYLVKNDYDGFFTPGCECRLNDLIPCDGHGIEISRCQPGYLRNCSSCMDYEEGKITCLGKMKEISVNGSICEDKCYKSKKQLRKLDISALDAIARKVEI